ncbi:hypothetical protein TRVL_05326 [Trypanosoma vivax]|nr:hypothetical protein TRVL_05326 [Trypanosoma vivax]
MRSLFVFSVSVSGLFDRKKCCELYERCCFPSSICLLLSNSSNGCERTLLHLPRLTDTRGRYLLRFITLLFLSLQPGPSRQTSSFRKTTLTCLNSSRVTPPDRFFRAPVSPRPPRHAIAPQAPF